MLNKEYNKESRMSQSKDVEVIQANAIDLKAYIDAKGAGKTKATDFCHYLKETRKSKAKEVIADISGVEFPNLKLNNVDLGNIIAGEKSGKSTSFQNCYMEGTKLRSNAPMKGLSFTHCNMSNASLVADLDEVNFGIGSDISYIDFKEAHNIDKCTIHDQCLVHNVQLGFPDLETFTKHMEGNLNQQVELRENDSKHQSEIARRTASTPKAPEVAVATAEPEHTGWRFGLPAAMRGAVNLASGAVNAAWSLGGAAVSTAGKLATTNITVGDDAPADQVRLHQNALQKIIKSGPSFAATLEYVEPENVVTISAAQVKEWVKAYEGVDPSDKMSLSEFIRDDKDERPHLQNLDLKGIDFSGLDFGDVVMSKCDLSGATLHECNLESVSARDCNFDNTDIKETTAKGADLTRCTFKGAKIDKVSFQGANLTETNFSTGDLPTQITNTSLNDTDMRAANIDGAKVENTTLDRANMQALSGQGAMMFNVSADQVNLTDAQLPGAGMRDVNITNSIGTDANLDNAALDRVKMTEFDAQGINLDKTEQRNVTISESDMSFGSMNGAVLANVKIDNSKLLKMQAQQVKTFSPSLAAIPEEDEIEQAASAAIANVQLKEGVENDASFDAAKSDTITAALESKAPAVGLTISNTDARAIDLSGGHLNSTQVTNTDMSHAKMANTVLQNAAIENTNLHGAQLSNAKLLKTKLSKVNATGATMDHIKVRGGEWDDLNIEGANIFDAELGTSDNKLDMHNVKADIATNLASTTTAIIDSKTPDQKAVVTVTDLEGNKTQETPADLATKHTMQVALTANTPTNVVAALASKGAGALNAAANVVANATEQLKAPQKKSRMGLAVGILGGIVAGGIVAGIAASTFGLGLIPLGIVAATTIGVGAIGGGIAGSVTQNTNTGRGFLAAATAGVAAMVVGPIGLIAAPAVALYNVITNNKSSFRDALSDAMGTFVSKPLKAVSGFVSGFVPNEADVIDAQEAKNAREANTARVNTEAAALDATARLDSHAHAENIAQQVATNKQHGPIVEQAKPKAQEQAQEKPQTKSFASRFASKVKEKIMPKKKTGSHAEAIQEERAAAPTVVQQK